MLDAVYAAIDVHVVCLLSTGGALLMMMIEGFPVLQQEKGMS